ncbi:MAG: ATP-binding protein, partial [Hyphomicrobiales bacterium]
MSFHGEPVTVSNEIAIALGLITNELVINALKHAFPASEGAIEVSLARAREGKLRLTIADTGVGMTPSAGSEGSFGLLIVDTLAGKLNSTVVREPSANGTKLSLLLYEEIRVVKVC